MADIPAGTGLGSSGASRRPAASALRHRREHVIPGELAELACDIEIECLGEPVGKQDQYIAAFGGLTCFTFNPDGSGRRRAARDLASTTLHDLEDNLLLFFTGFSRSGRHDPRGPDDAPSRPTTRRCSTNLHYVKELGLRSREALESGDTAALRRADARALGAQAQALAAA